MAERKKVYVNFVTPLGTARFPKLHKKDVYKGKETKYVLDIVFDDAETAKVKDAIKAAHKQIFGSEKPESTPWKKKTDKKTGQPVEYLHATTKNICPLFMKDGQTKLPEGKILTGGSKIRAKISFTEGNGHLVAYVNAVQVAKLVEYDGGGGFDELEGFDDDDDAGGSDTGFDSVEDDDLDI
jgi:hypothetical protein